MYGVYLIAALVLTGGAIAFIGDRLGTKIGKKRLSIFGLRPRHTSIIITIFTGICITTLTFGVMAAASENVRTALFGMDQLNERMERTANELSKAMDELSGAKEEQVLANEALNKSKAEIEVLMKEQEELRHESDRLKQGNQELEIEKASLMAMNDELLGANAELSASNSQLEDSNRDLENRAKLLRDGLITIREGDIIFRSGEVIASGVVQSNRSRDEIEADIDSIANLARQKVSERLGAPVSPENLLVYRPEYELAVSAIEESGKDMIVRVVAAANMVKGEPIHTSIQLYPNSIVYEKDEFIVGRAYEVSADTDPEQIVMSFLKDVNEAATTKGILPDPIRGTVGVIEGEQFYDVVQTIVPLRGVIALSAYARDVTDAMGPLRLNLKLEEMRK
ncbi:MAG TPA: DUF3084 domain-containing protein [Selenomonas sp.]|nr:DUF3084 domain-containing protein [Selenomonadaceae bacterium]HCB93304.1 DUF3084 domain-containing protein [Selenomonas sp.]